MSLSAVPGIDGSTTPFEKLGTNENNLIAFIRVRCLLFVSDCSRQHVLCWHS